MQFTSQCYTQKTCTLISAGLLERTEYGFQVRAKTSQKWGEFTPPVYQMTGGEDPEAYPLPESAGTPAIVGRTFCVIIRACCFKI